VHNFPPFYVRLRFGILFVSSKHFKYPLSSPSKENPLLFRYANISAISAPFTLASGSFSFFITSPPYIAEPIGRITDITNYGYELIALIKSKSRWEKIKDKLPKIGVSDIIALYQIAASFA
jgi:hypothetical protein